MTRTSEFDHGAGICDNGGYQLVRWTWAITGLVQRQEPLGVLPPDDGAGG